jgi:hypothetical protein
MLSTLQCLGARCVGSPQLQRLFPPRQSCQLPLYPNPTLLTLLLTLSWLSHPSNMVASQRWGFPVGPPSGCPHGGSSSWMSRRVCPGSTSSSRARSSHALLLPFSIKQLHNSAMLALHQPRLIELKEELDQAYRAGDKLAVQSSSAWLMFV